MSLELSDTAVLCGQLHAWKKMQRTENAGKKFSRDFVTNCDNSANFCCVFLSPLSIVIIVVDNFYNCKRF